MIRSLAESRPALTRAPSRRLMALLHCAFIAGCSSSSGPVPLVSGPTSVHPAATPTYLERNVTGSLYHANSTAGALFSNQQKPHAIGDTLKVEISESLNASSKVTSDNSSANTVKSVGPGSKSLPAPLASIADLNASASGSDTFNGKGDSTNSSRFTAHMVAYVINVLPNGNLVVAGERRLAFNTGMMTMRFSGVVNPADIKAGGIVASSDVADAKLELVGTGDPVEPQGATLLKKLLGIW